MIFTNEELEKTMEEHRIDGENNQEIVKRIHLMFGGEYHEKDNFFYNHLNIKLYNGENLYLVYDVHNKLFAFSHTPKKYINQWKLKKLIERMETVLKKDKENKLKIKMKKIEGDF